MTRPPLYYALDKIADFINPALFVTLIVVLVLSSRRERDFRLGAFIGRTLLSGVFAYLVSHPDKVWRGWRAATGDFDMSGHTAFFLVPAVALCVLGPKWLRLVVPLGLFYAALMMYQRYHTFAEIVLTTVLVVPIAWACHALQRSKPERVLNSPV